MNLKLYLYKRHLWRLGRIMPSTAVSPQSAFVQGRGKFPKEGEASEVLRAARATGESRDQSRMWGSFVSSKLGLDGKNCEMARLDPEAKFQPCLPPSAFTCHRHPLRSHPSPAFLQHVKVMVEVTRALLHSQMTCVRHDALNPGQVRISKSLLDVNLGTSTLGNHAMSRLHMLARSLT